MTVAYRSRAVAYLPVCSSRMTVVGVQKSIEGPKAIGFTIGGESDNIYSNVLQ